MRLPLFCILVFLSATGCNKKFKFGSQGAEANKSGVTAAAVLVQAKKQDLFVGSSFRGAVQSAVRIDIRSETKIRLRRALVKNGQTVAKDTLLFEIDTTELAKRKKDAQDRLVSLNLEITGARSRFGFAKKSLDRKVALSAKGIIAEKEKDEATKSAQQSDIDLKTKALEIEKAKNELNEVVAQEKIVRITAPIDGLVSDLVQVKPGDDVNQGQLLLTLSDPRKLVLAAMVDETNAERVKPGMPAAVQLDALSGKKLAATVRTIAFSTEPEGGYGQSAPALNSYKAIFTFEGATTGLQSGYEGSVNLQFAKATNVVVVPLAALKFADGKSFVLASRSATGSPSPQEVELGLKTDLEVEIKAGLKGDEYVAIGDVP